MNSKNKISKPQGSEGWNPCGGIGIYCAHEALQNAGYSRKFKPLRIGVYLGITEHGNVETETEVCRWLTITMKMSNTGPIITTPEL